jgi:hypothetical protein
MRTIQSCALGVLATVGLGALSVSDAVAEKVIRQIDENTVSITNFSGKPPFQRRIVAIDNLSAAEFARFEEMRAEPAVDASRIGETITVVDYRGKPPFSRRVVEIDETNAVEFARFEEVTEVERPLRPRFAGKRFPVRR